VEVNTIFCAGQSRLQQHLLDGCRRAGIDQEPVESEDVDEDIEEEMSVE
jgi:hypothetical protein